MKNGYDSEKTRVFWSEQTQKFEQEHPFELAEAQKMDERHRIMKECAKNTFEAVVVQIDGFSCSVKDDFNKIITVTDMNGFKPSVDDFVMIGRSDDYSVVKIFRVFEKERVKSVDEQEKEFKELGGDY